MHKLFTRLAGAWFIRWALEMGGWTYAVVQGYFILYNSLPPTLQAAVDRAWAGGWEEITLGSIVALVPIVWARVWSFKATTATQIVTPEGERVVPAQEDKPVVRRTAQQVSRKPTLLDGLRERFGGKR